MAPRIAERRQIECPLLWIEFEKLAVVMATLDRKAGMAMDLSPEGLTAGIKEAMRYAMDPAVRARAQEWRDPVMAGSDSFARACKHGVSGAT